MVSPSVKHFRPDLKGDMKYVLVSGGVCSSLGKGVVTSSIGALLKAKGFHVTAIKIDPYLNIDAGLMSPYEHGEVFVLDDGGEADLDLGNYERMMNLSLGRDNNVTTGKIYSSVINKERRGDYLGKTVQVVPHITSEIITWLDKVAHTPTDGTGKVPDICVVELGGTVGDIESMPFLEALRQFRFTLPPASMCWVHCSYIPIMSGQKTKPTQHTVKVLQSLGLQPDVLVGRCESPVEEGTKRKISNQCNIRVENVISCHNVSNLFHVIDLLQEQNVYGVLSSVLQLTETPTRHSAFKSLDNWRQFAKSVDQARESRDVRIAFVGKYNKGGEDAYVSVIKALEHATVKCGRNLVIEWINSTDLQPCDQQIVTEGETLVDPQKACDDALALMKECDGVFIPGGFGDRGTEGKIRAAQFARENKIPYFGVCLGMQVAIIEYARNVLGLADATSEEFDVDKSSQNHVLEYMPEISKETMGANMRLGARWVICDKDSIASKLYGGAEKVTERHRHRYEFNTKYLDQFENNGFKFIGRDEKKERMDIISIPEHPFFFAVQYHPEFKSRPAAPSPPFLGFIQAACDINKLDDCLNECVKAGPSTHYTSLTDLDLE
eukprot:TRINITY_DN7531_c0_g1_i1.p1 TRINITY_DN7531_c0_g1~~TRINITY_DN7531_c0_g1_i1.p1  ORF type:complete len:638 (+),score=130.45 TRINITY_DN7531_c0_g1_i1:91-1914(+)